MSLSVTRSRLHSCSASPVAALAYQSASSDARQRPLPPTLTRRRLVSSCSLGGNPPRNRLPSSLSSWRCARSPSSSGSSPTRPLCGSEMLVTLPSSSVPIPYHSPIGSSLIQPVLRDQLSPSVPRYSATRTSRSDRDSPPHLGRPSVASMAAYHVFKPGGTQRSVPRVYNAERPSSDLIQIGNVPLKPPF